MRKAAFASASVVIFAFVANAALAADAIPRAVKVARATEIPACTLVRRRGRQERRWNSAIPAQDDRRRGRPPRESGAVICVAEGTYAEQIEPADKFFTLAGGFQRGSGFKVRDSAKYVSKAQGKGGSMAAHSCTSSTRAPRTG